MPETTQPEMSSIPSDVDVRLVNSEINVQSDRGEPVRVMYVPGGPRANRMHYPENTIVLDEALQDDSLVHDYVLAHELRHAEIGYDQPQDWLRQLRHEFKTDLHRHLGLDETSRALREYSNRETPEGTDALVDILHEFLFGLCRGLWQIPMLLGRPIRACYEYVSGGER